MNLGELAATVGPTAAVLIFMYLNRAPTSKEKSDDPVARLAAKMNSIADDVQDVKSDLKILLDRNKR